mmetsp:Transcript_1116/g.1725  ORF Transcript_1116/g.1725 Transcript_1116/m.1725 type:complete len:136 (-) Transcript_1116:553-960(-)
MQLFFLSSSLRSSLSIYHSFLSNCCPSVVQQPFYCWQFYNLLASITHAQLRSASFLVTSSAETPSDLSNLNSPLSAIAFRAFGQQLKRGEEGGEEGEEICDDEEDDEEANFNDEKESSISCVEAPLLFVVDFRGP